MTGYLLDENLPLDPRCTSTLPITHVNDLGVSPTDTAIWNHAKANDLAIVSKDADFSDRIMLAQPPPRIVHLRFGNLRLPAFRDLMGSAWPSIEELAPCHRLVCVYLDRIEAFT